MMPIDERRTSTLKELVSKAMEQGGRLRVKSALNPALWLCAIVSLPILFLYAFLEDPPLVLAIVGSFPIGIACVGFLFLLIFDRDKLQSEDYQIRKRSLEMIEQSDGLKLADPTNLHLIANPSSKSE